MNIDNLKDAWNNDEPQGMHLPDSTEALGKTTSVIAKVRSNMKQEFIGSIISYAILLWFMVYHHQTPFFLNLASILFLTVFILNAYFYIRFYAFYKAIAKYDLNMRESIRKVAYELELNTEIYKTYNFCITPLVIILIVALFCGQGVSKYVLMILTSEKFLSSGVMLWLVLTAIASVIITYIINIYYIHALYGKYVKELKQVVDDLGSDA